MYRSLSVRVMRINVLPFEPLQSFPAGPGVLAVFKGLSDFEYHLRSKQLKKRVLVAQPLVCC